MLKNIYAPCKVLAPTLLKGISVWLCKPQDMWTKRYLFSVQVDAYAWSIALSSVSIVSPDRVLPSLLTRSLVLEQRWERHKERKDFPPSEIRIVEDTLSEMRLRSPSDQDSLAWIKSPWILWPGYPFLLQVARGLGRAHYSADPSSKTGPTWGWKVLSKNERKSLFLWENKIRW